MPSTVVSARTFSSVVNFVTSPFLPLTSTTNFSASNSPFAVASAALRWLSAANWSWAERDTSYFSATFSAVSPMWKSL